MDSDKKLAWAKFRFSVIAPLVCRRFEDETHRRAVRADILNSIFVTPDGHQKRVGKRTLSDWVTRYSRGGFDALVDVTRSTFGTCRAIPPDLLDRAEQLRREIDVRSVRSIMSLLRAEGFDISKISKSTLNSQLTRRGASRGTLSPDKGAHQRWEQGYANKLWQADTSAGIWLPDPTNPKTVKRTKLISFIDDATRVCTHAEFYWDEKLPSLIDCFRKALLKRGKPDRLLCDNAFIYHSTTMELVCAQLQPPIEISFCQPYSPESKGKIEKHYRTIKDAFYIEASHAGLTSIDELNQFFWAWLTREYHHVVHTGIGVTPLERWRKDEHLLRRVTPDDIRRALMLRTRRQVNKKTALIRMDNRFYQASRDLAGTRVDIRWPAGQPDQLEIWRDGKLIELAQHTTASANIDFTRRPEKTRPRPGTPLESSKNYKRSLLSEHQGESFLPPVSPPDTYLSEPEFIQIFADSFSRELEPEESEILSKFFFEHSPLRANRCSALVSQAVNAKGTKMHLRYYLEHIQRANLQSRRNKNDQTKNT
jgi:hypothetical protein